MRPVFIHVNKTAGTSIVASGGAHIVNAGHRTAASWVAEHGTAAPLFSVVRHPYDRVRSEYTFRRRRWASGEDNPHLANLDLPFDAWVRATFVDGHFRTRTFFEQTGVAFNERNMVGDQLCWFLPQVRWLADADGQLLVEELLHFEHLERDWSDFCNRYGFDAPLLRLNASPVDPGVEASFGQEVRDVIAEYHAVDFEIFGFEP